LNQDLVLDTPLDLGATQDNDMELEASRRERVMRCYRHPGGPLLGWLADEAKRRGHTGQAMAESLGVTAGYIHQLRTGHRHLCNISDLSLARVRATLACHPSWSSSWQGALP